jgi:hypothetical protein
VIIWKPYKRYCAAQYILFDRQLVHRIGKDNQAGKTNLLLTKNRKLAGLALRQCIDLGYHRNSTRLRLNAYPLRLELRRRVFWCAYAMECAAAVMLGRPIGIPDQEVDAEVL